MRLFVLNFFRETKVISKASCIRIYKMVGSKDGGLSTHEGSILGFLFKKKESEIAACKLQ